MMGPPKKGEIEGVMRARQRTKIPALLLSVGMDVSNISDPQLRSNLITKLQSLSGSETLFIVPYAPYVPRMYDAMGEPVPEEEVAPLWKVQASRSALKNPCSDPKTLRDAWAQVAKVRGLEFVSEHRRVLADSNRFVCEFDQFTDEFIQHCVKTNVAPDPPSSIAYLDHSGKPVKVIMPMKGARNLNYTEYAALSASVWKGAVFEMTAVPNIGDGCYYNPVSVHMILPRSFVYKLDKGESVPR